MTTTRRKGLPFPDSDGVQKAAETVTGQSFAEFFQSYVAGVRELPYNEFFQFVGLQAAETTGRYSTPGFTTTANLGGQPVVASVDANSEAQRAGVNVGDRVIELNGKPADAGLDEQLSRMREGAKVKLKFANAKGEHKIKLKLSAHDQNFFVLQDVPNITPEQRLHRQAWIHGDDENGGPQ